MDSGNREVCIPKINTKKARTKQKENGEGKCNSLLCCKHTAFLMAHYKAGHCKCHCSDETRVAPFGKRATNRVKR